MIRIRIIIIIIMIIKIIIMIIIVKAKIVIIIVRINDRLVRKYRSRAADSQIWIILRDYLDSYAF